MDAPPIPACPDAEYRIRDFHPSDYPVLYRICLQTGHAGADATALYRDPDLLGHFYCGPYLALCPDTCLVLTRDGEPCGYILGCPDSAYFARRCESDWFPVLRERYSVPAKEDGSADAALVRLILQGYEPPFAWLGSHPAHLHIDLLPCAQGGGRGRMLMDALVERLVARGCPGLHLGVGTANTRGIRFYERYGFRTLQEFEGWQLMGLTLPAGLDPD